MNEPRGIYPPELVLPGPEEDTEQWRIENLNSKEIDFETAIAYSAFMVALRVVAQSDKTAPQTNDFTQMRAKGYGIPKTRICKDFSIAEIQSGLKYFPRSSPIEDIDFVQRRIEFVGRIVQENQNYFRVVPPEGILSWSGRRLLTPGLRELRSAFTATEIREHLQLPQRPTRTPITASRQRLINLGQDLLIEHVRPLNNRELATIKDPETGISLHRLVVNSFGSSSNFWRKLGRNTHQQSRGSSPNEAVYATIRANTPMRQMRRQAKTLSHSRIVSRHLAEKYPGGIRVFRNAIHTEKTMIGSVFGNDVAPSLRLALLRDYVGLEDLEQRIESTRPILARLSQNDELATWIRKLAENGLDIRKGREDIFDMQLEDLKEALKKFKVISVENRLFVGRLIPAFDEYQLLSKAEAAELRS